MRARARRNARAHTQTDIIRSLYRTCAFIKARTHQCPLKAYTEQTHANRQTKVVRSARTHECTPTLKSLQRTFSTRQLCSRFRMHARIAHDKAYAEHTADTALRARRTQARTPTVRSWHGASRTQRDLLLGRELYLHAIVMRCRSIRTHVLGLHDLSVIIPWAQNRRFMQPRYVILKFSMPLFEHFLVEMCSCLALSVSVSLSVWFPIPLSVSLSHFAY